MESNLPLLKCWLPIVTSFQTRESMEMEKMNYLTMDNLTHTALVRWLVLKLTIISHVDSMQLLHVMWWEWFSSVKFSRSVVSDSLRPHELQQAGLPVHHHLPEFTQTHVHRVSDAIQPSHPLSSPSPPAPNLSKHQSLFQWVKSLHEVAKVLELQL